MNILVISQYFWPENFRINELCKYLSKKKKITVLTSKPSYPNDQIYSKYKNIDNIGKVKIIRVPTISRGSNKITLILNYLFFIFFSILYSIKISITKKVDKVIVFGTSPPTGLISAHIIRIFKNADLHYWILDLWPNTISAFGYKKKSLIYQLIEKFMNYSYRKSKYVYCQSLSIQKIISKKTKTKNSAVYFPSWSEKLIKNKKKQSYRNTVSKNNFNIMFTGNIGQAQDFGSVVKAAKILKKIGNIKWIIVGSGRYKANLKNLIIKNNLEDNFTLIDHQKREYISYLVSLSDCLLISLKKKRVFSVTVPGKLSNYLNSSTPILGMIDGETKKIIEQSKGGIVCGSGEYKQLAKNVLKLYKKTSKQRKQMGKNGFNYSKMYFNQIKLLRLFDNCLSR